MSRLMLSLNTKITKLNSNDTLYTSRRNPCFISILFSHILTTRDSRFFISEKRVKPFYFFGIFLFLCSSNFFVGVGILGNALYNMINL